MNTWIIEQLSCYPEVDNYQDVVFNAAWRVNGSETQGEVTYTATVYGTQSLSPYTEGQPFTPYAELTQEQVIGWVQDAMGAEQVTAIEANIAQQIQDQITPKVVTQPLPWSN